jgi:hypothetical protein
MKNFLQGGKAATFGLTAALALLAACGGQSPNALPQGAASQSQAHKASGASGVLLYVVTSDETDMLDYSSYQTEGTLSPSGFLGFACPNANNGDVFLDNGADVRQYYYGNPNVQATSYLKSSDFGYACAVDPVSSNLALTGTHKGKGAIILYKSVTSQPKVVSDKSLTVFYYCGYDDDGNLFADGLTKSNNVALAELPSGSGNFIDLTLPSKIRSLGNVEFDGTYITVRSGPTIYQLTISGSSANIVGSTTLKQLWTRPPSTWIEGDTVIGAQGGGNHPGHGLGFWHYPQGGKPFMVLRTVSKSKKDVILGAAVSVAPSQPRSRK